MSAEGIVVVVEKGVYGGRGLARHEGRVVFVPGGLPGDRVLVRLTRVRRDWAEASLERILEPGPGRRPAPCPHAVRCGGCAYQELEYAGQLALKGSVVRESLGRAGLEDPGPVAVVASPERGWRSRVRLHVRHGPGGVELGFHERGSHRLVPAEACIQLSEASLACLAELRRLVSRDASLAAVLGSVELTEPTRGSGSVLVLGVGASVETARVRGVLRELPGTTGLLVRDPGGRLVRVSGTPWLESPVGRVRLRHHAASFFQSNRALIDALVAHVVDRAHGTGPVLDLYAGCGPFAAALADTGRSVVAVEADRLAARAARHNLRPWSARVIEADVAEGLAQVPHGEDETVVIDPPRRGAGRAVVAGIVQRSPARIVYVSCDPPTLGRDLVGFAAAGYRLMDLHGFDMFPDTAHVEVVATLER